MKMTNETATNRCDTCGRGYCQGNEPCPTEHELTCEEIVRALRAAEQNTQTARFAAIAASYQGADRAAVAIDKWNAADRYETRLRSMLENL